MGSRIYSILFLLAVIGPFYIFSQNDFSNAVVEPLIKDALYREKVFIHLNKTIYFTNENVWFTAYVAKETNKPSDFTTNLRVNLLNEKGDVVESKNLFVKNGIAFGDFFIEKRLSSGTYYLHGYTNFMQNFGSQNVFLQEIEIINPSEKVASKKIQSRDNYDIQILPESGSLLEGVENIIGIKANHNNKGYPFNGKIIDSKGKEITTFKGNNFGMGSCDFFLAKNERYTVIVHVNETIQKISLEEAHKTGIIFSLDNSDVDKIKLIIKTNPETLPLLKNQEMVLLFYRNNTIYEAVGLSLKNGQQTTQELFFDKSNMLPGVNTVTLFKNYEPIAERKFFVDKSSEQTAVLIERVKLENDSILFKIETIGPDYKSVPAQLSISVLPKEALAFKEDQNIKSGFLLSPYIKGPIENPALYFKNTDPNEKDFLDLLLLNQSRGNFSLAEKIKEINPKEQFQFENGFTINGSIKKYPKGYDLGILSNKNILSAISKISEKKEFSFENVFAYKNDNLKIALIKKNKPLVRPEGVKFKMPEIKKMNYGYLTKAYSHARLSESAPAAVTDENAYTDLGMYPNAELLDEVILEAASFKKKENTIYEVEMGLANEHNVLSAGAYKNKKVTEQMETVYETIFDYFRNLGHIKLSPSNKVESYFITLRSAPATIIDLGGTANPDGSFPPRIYLNDILINREDNIETLRELSMKYVDEILINKSGAGGGVHGTGGIVRIYLKKGDHQYFDGGPKDLYESLTLPIGFDKTKAYYAPQYAIRSKEAFNWAEVDWKYALQTNEKGEGFIKIPKNGFSDEFKFIVNGFSSDGLLIHDIFTTGKGGF